MIVFTTPAHFAYFKYLRDVIVLVHFVPSLRCEGSMFRSLEELRSGKKLAAGGLKNYCSLLRILPITDWIFTEIESRPNY